MLSFMNKIFWSFFFFFGPSQLASIWIPRRCPRFAVYTFFFFNQCLLHCTWDMNSALRQMNSILWVWTVTRNYFFIISSFQQNKRYPNAPFIYVFVWVLIEVAFCFTFCCFGSCSNYITLKTNCWLCLLQHRRPADDMLMGCSSRSPVGDGPASPKYSDRLSCS